MPDLHLLENEGDITGPKKMCYLALPWLLKGVWAFIFYDDNDNLFLFYVKAVFNFIFYFLRKTLCINLFIKRQK